MSEADSAAQPTADAPASLNECQKIQKQAERVGVTFVGIAEKMVKLEQAGAKVLEWKAQWLLFPIMWVRRRSLYLKMARQHHRFNVAVEAANLLRNLQWDLTGTSKDVENMHAAIRECRRQESWTRFHALFALSALQPERASKIHVDAKHLTRYIFFAAVATVLVWALPGIDTWGDALRVGAPLVAVAIVILEGALLLFRKGEESKDNI